MDGRQSVSEASLVDAEEFGNFAKNGSDETERAQYITKFPSSSLLRITPDRIDRTTALEACIAIKHQDQQAFFESFNRFAEQIRGAQLHILKKSNEPNREELLQKFSGATDQNKDNFVFSHESDAFSCEDNNYTIIKIIEGGIELGIPTSNQSGWNGNDTHDAEQNFAKHSSLKHPPKGVALCEKDEKTENTPGTYGQLSNLLIHISNDVELYHVMGTSREVKRISTYSTADFSKGDDQEHFIVEKDVNSNKYVKSNAKINSRRVLLPGALVPLALDDSLVIEQVLNLVNNNNNSNSNTQVLMPYNNTANNGKFEKRLDAQNLNDSSGSIIAGSSRSTAADECSISQQLEEVLHKHAPKGLFSANLSVAQQTKSGSRRASGPRFVDASVSAFMDPINQQVASVFYHFRDNVEAAMCMETPEWKKFQSLLLNCASFLNVRTYQGVCHTKREDTGLCIGKPTILEGFSGASSTIKSQFSQYQAPRDTYNWSAQGDGCAIVTEDPSLHVCVSHLKERHSCLKSIVKNITTNFGSLSQFADGYKVFGFHRIEKSENVAPYFGRTGWIYREWLPNAKEAYLFGTFNNWNRSSHPLTLEQSQKAPFFYEIPIAKQVENTESDSKTNTQPGGVFSIFLPDMVDGKWQLQHKSLVRVHVVPMEGEDCDRVPAWSRVVWKSEDSGLFNGVIWSPDSTTTSPYTFKHPRIALNDCTGMKIYEAHVGSSTNVEGAVGTFVEFRQRVLPRIKLGGYNVLLLLDALEHADYSSFGVYVTNSFAITSRLGTLEEFKELIDAAHKLNIRVCLSVTHAFASKNALEGLGCMDGSPDAYFVNGPEAEHPDFDQARIFNVSKTEVMRYLLSNIKFLIQEYMIDGFRFENVSSMIYKHHGIGHTFDPFNYSTFFSKDLHLDGIVHLCLTNMLIQQLESELQTGDSVLSAKNQLQAEKCHPECQCIENVYNKSDNKNTLANNAKKIKLLSIANETTGFPSLCRCIWRGGMGFDYRYTADFGQSIRDIIQTSGHRHGRWINARQLYAMTTRANTEKILVSLEDSDSTRICKRPLLIALFSWESLHTHAVGGVAPHVTELGAALCRLGHNVHIFVRATGVSSACSVHYGVTYHQCTFELNSDFVIEIQNMCTSFINSMLSIEDSMGRNFDICHAHDWLAAKAVVRAKELGRVAVLTMHSTEFGRCGNNAYGGVSKRIRDVEAEGCHIADRVICVSGVLASEVREQYNIHPAKITVIYNGINCSPFDGCIDSGAVKREYGISDMDPMFLFVGRMVVQKGPDLLLEAIPHVLQFRSDAKFVLVGDGHLMQQLQARAAQLNVLHAVRFVGKLSGPPLYALFKACDSVVVPSRNEPFGIVVLEAWSAGKPVVATNSGGPRDFVNPNHTGVLVDPTPGSISWGCCEILKDFDHSRWMGSRGRVTAAFNFSWDSIGQRTRDIYFEQVNRHDLPPMRSKATIGDETLAFSIIGPAMYSNMSIQDNCEIASQGLARWRAYKLLVAALGDGYLNYMGNEFAHPDAVDLPRPATHFSFQRAFTRWELADNADLKFSECSLFDVSLQHWIELLGLHESTHLYLTVCDEEKQVAVIERGSCLLAFNFHPHTSYDGYHVGSMFSENLAAAFDTDDTRFGGYGRLTPGALHPSLSAKDGRPYSVKIYLPCNSAIVYMQENDLAKVMEKKKTMNLNVLNATSSELTSYIRKLINC